MASDLRGSMPRFMSKSAAAKGGFCFNLLPSIRNSPFWLSNAPANITEWSATRPGAVVLRMCVFCGQPLRISSSGYSLRSRLTLFTSCSPTRGRKKRHHKAPSLFSRCYGGHGCMPQTRRTAVGKNRPSALCHNHRGRTGSGCRSGIDQPERSIFRASLDWL